MSGAWPSLPSLGWAMRYPGSSPRSQKPDDKKNKLSSFVFGQKGVQFFTILSHYSLHILSLLTIMSWSCTDNHHSGYLCFCLLSIFMSENCPCYCWSNQFSNMNTLTRSQVRHWTELTMVPSNTSETILRYFFWCLFFGGENVATAEITREKYQKLCKINLDEPGFELTKVPFLCVGFRPCHPEAAFGGLLDNLGICPSIRTGLCGLVMLDIWRSRKEPRVDGLIISK